MAEKITSREQLIYALTEVVQLEHTLMCQYLFAAASIKSSVSEFKGERRYHQFELARAWKRDLLVIGREEMQHMTYAINLLISIGGAPTVLRPNFPNRNRFYREKDGSGLLMTLEPFTLKSIERFIEFEAAPPAEPRMEKFVPQPNYYQTLREFYTEIQKALTDDMFIGKEQYNPNEGDGSPVSLRYRAPIRNIVTTAAEARVLIDKIIEQGEGSTGEDPMAHVNIFKDMKNALEAEMKIDPSFECGRKVVPNTLTRYPDELEDGLKKEVNIVSNPLPYNLLQLFSGSYELMLTWLYQIFDRRGSKQELFAIETLAFLPYMSEVIRPLMEFLTKISAEVKGQPGNLGASFELTSNNALVAKGETTLKITNERFRNLLALAEEILKQLRSSSYASDAELIKDFDFIKETIRIFGEEFSSRVESGWPPVIKSYPPASESITNADWSMRSGHVLRLDFQGWFQCRLGTDPDGAAEKRGVTGNAFAIGEEPDMDRVIRFQDNGQTVNRSHCPKIGINVVKAQLQAAPLGLDVNLGDVNEFIGANVDLLDSPKYEGRNHLVSEDGEPIDPFHLSITSTDGKIVMTRKVLHTISINEMKAVDRRMSGRFPTRGASASVENCSRNLKRIQIVKSPLQFIEDRIKALEADLKGREHEISAEIESIKFRLAGLYDTLKSSQGIPVRTGVRWTRFFFDVTYNHTLSGKASVDTSKSSLGFKIDGNKKWQIKYQMGFYDSDALAGYTFGEILIPVNLL